MEKGCGAPSSQKQEAVESAEYVKEVRGGYIRREKRERMSERV